MAELNHCPQCGCGMPPDAPAGLCPDCLLGVGLGISDPELGAQLVTEARARQGFVPPSPQELADRFPQFEILELLGYGGMGAVYKARQKSLDRLVALKIIKPDAAHDSGFAERFAREAKALARLNHSAIVSVHDFGESDGLFFFVMEYVDGANLRRLMESRKLSSEQALQIIPQVCEALQFAHDEGIVHRDIKPENILVEMRPKKGSDLDCAKHPQPDTKMGADPDCAQHPEGRSGNRGPTPFSVRVKIADFGLAKLLGQTAIDDHTLTGTHQVMGTPRYMAPEQMEGSKAIDHRADIYSLGVVFYEMLTGELPMGNFELPSRKVQVDARLDEIVMRSLAKEPERRYQHASEVKTDVESIQSRVVACNHHSGGGDKVVASNHPTPTTPEATKDDVLITAVLLLVFLASGLGMATMFLPWSQVQISSVSGGSQGLARLGNHYLYAEGHRYFLPVLGSALSLTLFVFAAVLKILGEFPSSTRAMLSATTGLTLAISSGLIFAFAPLPNLPQDYSRVLRQAQHSFTDSDWSMRELQSLEVRGAIDVRVDLNAPGCLMSALCGVCLVLAAVLEMRLVIASQARMAKGNASESVRGPAAALRWASWASPVMVAVLIVMNARYSASHSTDATFLTFALVLQILHALLLAPLIWIGAARMESFLSRRLAIAVCILSMLPVGLSFLFGLPAAIWALIVLARPEVEIAFGERRLEPHVVEQQLRRAGSWLFTTAALGFANWAIVLGIGAAMILHDMWQGDDALVRDFWIMLAGRELPAPFWPFLIVGPIYLTLNLVQMLCARRLWRLRSASSGMTAAVVSLIPTSGFWIIGLPLGVWTLAVLRQSGVEEIFATRAKPLPKPDAEGAPLEVWHLAVDMCIVTPVLALIGFAMWYAETAWVLAALALPWFGLCMNVQYYEEKPDKKGEAKAVKLLMLLAFLITIVLIGLGIFLAKSAVPLFGLVPVVIGGFAGCLIGHFAGKDEEDEEARAEVSTSKEASDDDDEDEDEQETPEEKLEWAAWFIGLIGAARAWGLLTNVDNVFDKLAAGEFSLSHSLLLQLTGPLLVVAAIAAYHARLYWLAVAGAVLCLPTGNCVPVILGFYSLIALFDPKVRALFLANEAALGASGFAGDGAQVAAKPPMPRGYGDAIGSTLSHAWTEWWRERDALFTRVVQSVIMLLHVVCLLAFLGFSTGRSVNSEGQSVFAHNIGVPSPWFTIETVSGGNEFSFHHEMHWTTSAWIVAGLGLGLAYIYCRIEKVRNPDITFWHKPEAFIMIWGILALVDIGIGAGLGQLAMNVKRPDKVPAKQVAEATDAETDSTAFDPKLKRERGTEEKQENEDPSLTRQVVIDSQVAALIAAVTQGNFGRVREQLDAGASVNAKDAEGRTLLMQAIANGHRSLALTLVVLGADLTEQDERGRTAMMYAVEAKDKVFLSRLRDLQTITYESDADKRKAELRAFSGVERTLLDGRDFDLRNVEYTDLEVQKDANGDTASLLAARAGDWDLYSKVASHVDSVRARDNRGRTIAMHAATQGHALWFEMLSDPRYFGIAGKADVYIGGMVPFDVNQLALTDSDGKTALQLAEENGHSEIADILRRHLQAVVENQTAEVDEGGDEVAKHRELRRLAWQALGEAEKAKQDANATNAKPA